MTARQEETIVWQPDEQQLHLLHDAVRRGDRAAYLDTFLNSSVVMSVDPDSDDWASASLESHTFVVVFTSVEALHAVPDGAEQYHRVWPVIDLLHAWPDPDWALLIDGGLPTEVVLKPSTIAELTARSAEMYPLDAALRVAQDQDSYVAALRTAEVVVPMSPDGSPSRDMGNPNFAWLRTELEGGQPAIALFSSPVRLQVTLGEVPWLAVPFATLLTHWPDGCAALVDPRHDIGRRLPAEVMTAEAREVTEY